MRLMALEWAPPVFRRGAENSLSLRLLGVGRQRDAQAARSAASTYSVYNPSNPVSRDWQPVEVLGWTNGRDVGTLKFRVPDVDFGYVALRVQIFESGDPNVVSPLSAEITGCIIDRDQHGTASFVTNRGRNAFVVGEEIPLTLVLRSQAARAAGNRTVRLTHPDGYQETLAVADPGDAWHAASLQLAAERTRQLAPGRYTLAVADLPAGIVAVPFTFDLAGRQKSSLFHIVKPSKYTGAMNGLETSHLRKALPIDLDRADGHDRRVRLHARRSDDLHHQPPRALLHLARGTGGRRSAIAAAGKRLCAQPTRSDPECLRPQSAAVFRRVAELRRLSPAAADRKLHPGVGAVDGPRDAGHASLAGPRRDDALRRNVPDRP